MSVWLPANHTRTLGIGIIADAWSAIRCVGIYSAFVDAAAQGGLLESAALNQFAILASMDFVHAT
jgi:hypothetical protein